MCLHTHTHHTYSHWSLSGPLPETAVHKRHDRGKHVLWLAWYVYELCATEFTNWSILLRRSDVKRLIDELITRATENAGLENTGHGVENARPVTEVTSVVKQK